MSKNFVLTDGQSGYEVIGDYIQRYWDNKIYTTVIVSVGTSFDGEEYFFENIIATPDNGRDLLYLEDWWEGEKYITLEGIMDVEEVDVNGGIFEPSERSENETN